LGADTSVTSRHNMPSCWRCFLLLALRASAALSIWLPEEYAPPRYAPRILRLNNSTRNNAAAKQHLPAAALCASLFWHAAATPLCLPARWRRCCSPTRLPIYAVYLAEEPGHALTAFPASHTARKRAAGVYVNGLTLTWACFCHLRALHSASRTYLFSVGRHRVRGWYALCCGDGLPCLAWRPFTAWLANGHGRDKRRALHSPSAAPSSLHAASGGGTGVFRAENEAAPADRGGLAEEDAHFSRGREGRYAGSPCLYMTCLPVT